MSLAARVVPCTRPKGVPEKIHFCRVIGSTDINGKGTHNDLGSIGPFLLYDDVVVPTGMELPFGKHPHIGLVANTCPMPGYGDSEVGLWDNLNGNYGPLEAGGVFQIKAGRGIVHNEGMPFPTSTPLHPMGVVNQVWFHPGDGFDTDPAEYVLCKKSDIPTCSFGEGASARVLLGSVNGVTAPTKTWNAHLFLLTLTLQPNASASIPVPAGWEGFAHALIPASKRKETNRGTDAMLFESDGKQAGPMNTLVFGAEGGNMTLKSIAEEGIDIIVGAGVPPKAPWFKMLGNDGALICASKEDCAKGMAAYERDVDNFGKA